MTESQTGPWTLDDVRRSLAGVPGRGYRAMTAEQPDLPAVEGLRSLEVRWIFPGQVQAAMARWFGRFPAALELREDAYLLDPHLRGLSVKIRGGGGGPLEVKVYGGSSGILDIAGRARGRVESWQKWSFPRESSSRGGSDPAGWMLVRKKRRISVFPPVGGHGRAALPGLSREPGCAVELTEIRMGGEAWWTLGFEATGAVGMLGPELEATTALVFADAPPGGVEFGPGSSKSYAEWLGLRPDAGSAAGA
jgi:hypothetical protein